MSKIPMDDPYRQYVGQQGYMVKKCQTFDEQNRYYTLCKLTIQSQNQPTITPTDNYLSLNDYNTTKIVSCQNISPGYYPDMTQEMIGKRPVYSARDCEYTIPNTILYSRDNMVNKNFSCHQPMWT